MTLEMAEIEVDTLEDLALLEAQPGILVRVRSIGERFVFVDRATTVPNDVIVIDSVHEEGAWLKRRKRPPPPVLPALLTLAAIGASSVSMPRRSDSNESKLPRIHDDERALLEAEQKRARRVAKRQEQTDRLARRRK